MGTGAWRRLAITFLCSVATGEDRIERREGGERAGKQSVAVSGHAISFEAVAERPFVRSVLIHGARYGEGYDPTSTAFEVAICDEKLEILSKAEASYALFGEHIFTWVEVPLPEPVRVPAGFKVAVDFRATAKKGVYVGYAEVATSHSSYFRVGEKERSFTKGKEWMIRVRTSDAARPLRAPADPREVLRAAQVPRLDARDLAATLAEIAAAAQVPVVLDRPGAAPAPEIPAGSAEAALDRLARACGLVWDVRWGVAYLATPERLAAIPVALPETDADGERTPPDAVALRTELARRLVDLSCPDLRLEEAVAQVSSWLEFPVRFDPRVDRADRVTLAAESLRGEDALLLLLLPRGLGPRIVGRSVEIRPLGPKPLPDK
jgi:hypothetical protein